MAAQVARGLTQRGPSGVSSHTLGKAQRTRAQLPKVLADVQERKEARANRRARELVRVCMVVVMRTCEKDWVGGGRGERGAGEVGVLLKGDLDVLVWGL